MMNPATSPGSAQAELPVSRTTRTWLPRRPGLLALAWLAASAWGSVVQTQFNLNALTAPDLPLPAPIGLGLRLQTTLHDLLGFGPAYAALVLVAWLPALGLAAALGRRWPGWRGRLFTAAGGLGVVAAITAVNAVAPMPALIDATRSACGLGVMAAGCALSAGLYARAMSRPGR